MAGIFSFNEVEVLAFFLVLVRMSAFVVSWPIFGTTVLPAPAKVLFALSLAMLLFPVLNWGGVTASLDSLTIIPLVIREAFIGLAVGFLGRMFLFAMNISGQVISVSMGLSSSQLFNPSTGGTSTPLDQFQVMLVSLLFLAINGHHIFLGALIQSFDIVPLSSALLSLSHLDHMGQVVHDITLMGIKLAAPVMIAVLLMNMVMGIIGRAVPQINVLITALPVNILVGFFVMVVSLPIVLGQVEGLLDYSATEIFRMLKGF